MMDFFDRDTRIVIGFIQVGILVLLYFKPWAMKREVLRRTWLRALLLGLAFFLVSWGIIWGGIILLDDYL